MAAQSSASIRFTSPSKVNGKPHGADISKSGMVHTIWAVVYLVPYQLE
jgi:hypothetical protein